jgi:Family of unknown function (DUF6352)
MSLDTHSHEFWVSSGHVLLQRDDAGHLSVTDAYLKAFYARPEVMPPPEACDAERALHGRLMIAPFDAVTAGEINALADPDARENWKLLIAFRDLLLSSGTLEKAYLTLIKRGMGQTPPMFLNQMVHAVLRNALDGAHDPFVLRAAEMFFRAQRLTIHDGALLLADEETVDGAKVDTHASPLVAMFGEQAVKDLDVMSEETAHDYFARSDAFDMVLDFGLDKQARAALGRVVEVWVKHLTGLTCQVRPRAAINDEAWRWFIGLDAEATHIGNRLWQGKPVPEVDQKRVVALYDMTFEPDQRLSPDIAGKPVYLLLAMGEDRILRIKPQNLIAGLPLKEAH